MELTMEQRLSMAESKLTKDEQELYDFVDTHNKEFGITRKTGLTLVARNFFTAWSEDSLRNAEGFRDYYKSLDEEYRNNFALLFKAMSHDILIEMLVENPRTNLEINIHHCPFERPKHFELVYNVSLLHFINAYIVGQINVRFTLEQLLLRIIDIENEGIEY